MQWPLPLQHCIHRHYHSNSIHRHYHSNIAFTATTTPTLHSPPLPLQQHSPPLPLQHCIHRHYHSNSIHRHYHSNIAFTATTTPTLHSPPLPLQQHLPASGSVETFDGQVRLKFTSFETSDEKVCHFILGDVQSRYALSCSILRAGHRRFGRDFYKVQIFSFSLWIIQTLLIWCEILSCNGFLPQSLSQWKCGGIWWTGEVNVLELKHGMKKFAFSV